MTPRVERTNLECEPTIYSYAGLEPGTVITDFANQSIGGGCFVGSFVQEEQLVTQSSDFASRLLQDKTHMDRDEACTFEGVHIDLWWSKKHAAEKHDFRAKDASAIETEPLTILAVDAPNMAWCKAQKYVERLLLWLAQSTSFIFEVWRKLKAPRILSGLLGGGAF